MSNKKSSEDKPIYHRQRINRTPGRYIKIRAKDSKSTVIRLFSYLNMIIHFLLAPTIQNNFWETQ